MQLLSKNQELNKEINYQVYLFFQKDKIWSKKELEYMQLLLDWNQKNWTLNLLSQILKIE